MFPLHDAGRDLRRLLSEHIHVASPCGLGFLTARPSHHHQTYLVAQGFKGERPASIPFLSERGSHVASSSPPSIGYKPVKAQSPHIQGRGAQMPWPLDGRNVKANCSGTHRVGDTVLVIFGDTVDTPLTSFPSHSIPATVQLHRWPWLGLSRAFFPS